MEDTDAVPFRGFSLSSVLKFLPLKDVISYGSTSKNCLADTCADILRRRRRMLCCHRWTYANERATCRSSPNNKEATWSTSNFRLYAVDNDSKTDPLVDDGHLLMPVVDRLRILLQSKPFVASHPLYARVRELHGLLEQDADGNSNGYSGREGMNISVLGGEGKDSAAACECVGACEDSIDILELRWASRAHRLHADILRDAIRPYLEQQPASNGGVSVTVPLDRYVGDVLVAYFFMSHIVSGVVEGGPTEEDWMDEILASVSGRNAASATASSWYRAWIFLHSTVLRTAPFLPEHAALLGIEPRSTLCDGNAELVTDTLGLPPLIPPPPPFVGSDKRIMMSRLSQLRNDAPVKITKNTFGGLGPTFRGRDNVSSETVWPIRAISVIVAFFGLPPSAYHTATNPALLRWREGTEAGIRWLLDVHTEAGRTRPMTVVPPFITVTHKA